MQIEFQNNSCLFQTAIHINQWTERNRLIETNALPKCILLLLLSPFEYGGKPPSTDQLSHWNWSTSLVREKKESIPEVN